MTNFFYNLLVFFCSIIPGAYVWIAIVIITVLLRLIFLKSAISMVKMQHKQKKLSGKLAELKEKHKGDKQAEQQATMELYKAEGVNPLSSCLPMIIQIVVLIGFYGVFTKIGLGGEIKTNLLYAFTPRPESLNASFFGINLVETIKTLSASGGWIGIVVWLFPILTAGTQLIQSLQTKAMQPPTQAGDKGADFSKALNNQFIFLFPIMTAWISYTLPAALSIYWITQTVFMIVQQKIVMDKLKATEELAEEVAEVEGIKKLDVSRKGDVVVTVREKE